MKIERGITLVALVVTIVVLMILAGVSINVILGEDGIVSKAQFAKEEIRGASVEETTNLWKIKIEASNYTNMIVETLI